MRATTTMAENDLNTNTADSQRSLRQPTTRLDVIGNAPIANRKYSKGIRRRASHRSPASEGVRRRSPPAAKHARLSPLVPNPELHDLRTTSLSMLLLLLLLLPLLLM